MSTTPSPFGMFLEMTRGYPAYVIKNNDSGKVVGFCFLRAYNPMPAFRETAEISYFLDKEEVGRGIGREALRLLEREGGKMGIKYILANISSRNKQSLDFHSKNGFAECGRFLNIGRKKGKSFDVIWLESLADYAPSALKWSRPAGGFHIWCGLPEGFEAGSLLAAAVEKKVAFVPGGLFYAGEGGKDKFRLSFSRCSPEVIRKGISVVCEALRGMIGTGRHHKKTDRPIREEGQLF